jgi:hypothetical protein
MTLLAPIYFALGRGVVGLSEHFLAFSEHVTNLNSTTP